MTIAACCVWKLRFDELVEAYPFAVSVAALGLVAGFVCLVPAVVLFGLLLFIVPGLLLSLTPTVFLYVVAWWGLHVALTTVLGTCGLDPRGRWVRWPAGLAGAAAIVSLGFWIPEAANRNIEPVRAALTRSDIDAKSVIPIPRVVAVQSLTQTDGLCGAICQRLLFNRATEKVIVPGGYGSDGQTRAYVLRSGSRCSWSSVLGNDVAFPSDRPGKRGAGGEFRAKARIEAGDCLAFEPANMEEAELTIRIAWVLLYGRLHRPWAAPANAIGADRLELIDGAGRVLFRRTEVRADRLFAPLMINIGVSPLSTVSSVGWARDEVVTSELDVEARKVLPALLGDALRLPDLPGHMSDD